MSDIAAIVLTSAGDRAFCAGGDQKQRAQTGDYGPGTSHNVALTSVVIPGTSTVAAAIRIRLTWTGSPSALALSQAMDALRYLLELDSGNAAQYRAPLLDLQHNVLILLGEQQLARALSDQQPAALLRAYYEMFREFLPVTEEPGNGQVTLLVGKGKRSLNAAFLRDLLDPDEQVRAHVNTLTRNADLIGLLDLLLEIPDLPADMAQLLKQHRTLIQQAEG